MRTFDYAMTNIVLVLFTFAAFYGLWKYQYEDCITYKARNLTGDETGTVDFLPYGEDMSREIRFVWALIQL